MTDRDAVCDAVCAAERELGPTTTLIANAGGQTSYDVTNFRAQDIDDALQLNVVGVANCIEAVLPGMLERRSCRDGSSPRHCLDGMRHGGRGGVKLVSPR